MPESVRTADYFYVMVPDKPGEGARILGELKSAGVNLVAYSGFPSGRGAQLALARRVGKPVVVHCRNAHRSEERRVGKEGRARRGTQQDDRGEQNVSRRLH